eukprot:2312654-Pleurochrysis_carterae.AAC.4
MIRPDFEDTDAVVVVSTPSNAGGSTCPSDNLLGAGGAPGAVTSARSLQLNRLGFWTADSKVGLDRGSAFIDDARPWVMLHAGRHDFVHGLATSWASHERHWLLRSARSLHARRRHGRHLLPRGTASCRALLSNR